MIERRIVRMAIGAALLATLWLFSNPYIGIDHDARLYTMMAMRWLMPIAYARDPWFAFGSQDDWSLFSPLYAQVLVGAGVEYGALVTTLVAAALYIYSAHSLSRQVVKGAGGWLGTLLLVSVPINYSIQGMLNVSEGFATARMLAVPLSMLAVAYSLRRLPWFAAFFHVAALLLHPAMALSAALVSAMLSVPHCWRSRLALLGIFVAAGVLLAGVFGGLARLDGSWLAFVEPAPLIFIRSWVIADPLGPLAPLTLLLLASRIGIPRMRTLYQITALVAAGGMLFSLVAGDHAPVLIVMQAQFWRALWFAKVVGVLALVDLGTRFVLRRHAPLRPLWAALAAATLVGLPPACLFGGVWVSLHAKSATPVRRIAACLCRWQRGMFVLTIGLCVVALPGYVQSLSLAATSINEGNWLPDAATGFLRTGGSGLLALLVWWIGRKWSGPATSISVAIGLLIAGSLWDERSSMQRYWESRYSVDGSRRVFREQIQRGKTVYWHDSTPRVWMELATSGYASTTHATGLVFSRQRTEVLESRMTKVAVRALTEEQYRGVSSLQALLNFAQGSLTGEGTADIFVLARYESMSPSTRFGILRLCRDPDLDFVIDPMEFPGMYVAVEEETIAGRRVKLHLYQCSRLRERAE